jgi:hypothetical protein
MMSTMPLFVTSRPMDRPDGPAPIMRTGLVLSGFMLSVEENDGQQLSHYELVIVNDLCHCIVLYESTQCSGTKVACSAQIGPSTQLIPNHPI